MFINLWIQGPYIPSKGIPYSFTFLGEHHWFETNVISRSGSACSIWMSIEFAWPCLASLELDQRRCLQLSTSRSRTAVGIFCLSKLTRYVYGNKPTAHSRSLCRPFCLETTSPMSGGPVILSNFGKPPALHAGARSVLGSKCWPALVNFARQFLEPN
jgi:hypothetical protein